MTSDRERRIEELYAQALAYGSRERSTFLDQACGGDEALRHAVEALIAQRSFDRSLMQAAGARASGDRATRNPTWAGRRLGPYISLPLGPSQPTYWSDDGRYVIFSRSDGSGNNEMSVLPVDGERKPVAYVPTPSPAGQGCLSPDGKWMAYASSESGAMDIYVAPFPNPTAKWRISTAGGVQPRWRGDGKELFYLAPDKTLMAVSMPSPDRAAVPVPMFRTTATGYFYGSRNDYAPSQDGQRFLVNSIVTPGSQSIEVVLGWNTRS